MAEFIEITPTGGGSLRVVGNPATPSSVTPIYVGPAGDLGQYDGVSAISSGNQVTLTGTKGATTWAAGSAAACLNGGAVASSAALTGGYAVLSTSGVVLLGSPQPGETMSGYLRRARYWPRALTAAELQSVTR